MSVGGGEAADGMNAFGPGSAAAVSSNSPPVGLELHDVEAAMVAISTITSNGIKRRALLLLWLMRCPQLLGVGP